MVTACFLAFSACSASPVAPDPMASQLRSAPTAAVIAGTHVELQASLWRNFQPIVPPGGAPLIVSVTVPQSATAISIDRIWVLFGNEVFSGTPEQTSGSTEWVLRGGPQWGPNVAVDVVARLAATGSASQLVRVAGQPIIKAVF
jgi:hypothetical protein